MADPVSTGLGAVGVVGSLFGGASEARAAREEGAAKSAMYQYQAGIAEHNARIARENKDYTLVAGGIESRIYGLKAAQQMGQIVSAQAASGIDVDSGSSVDVRESQAFGNQFDNAMIINNAARRAYAYEQQAEGEEMQAELYRMAAADAQRAGERKAKASIIGGITGAGSKLLQGRQQGMW